jgi:hypothetical protein|tara:strand:+ start:82 stop:249 length:168 start_codon:yes stop_codon:yes gene_type:complete
MNLSRESYEDYMVRRSREEDEKNYSPLSTDQEILQIKEDIKKLQIDIAYMMKKYE